MNTRAKHPLLARIEKLERIVHLLRAISEVKTEQELKYLQARLRKEAHTLTP